MPFENDHVLLGKFVDSHERGDVEAAAQYWERLAINNYDRVVAAVRTFRFSASGPGIPAHEHGSAVTEAFLRVSAMSAVFRKRETGRFYAALNTCVEHACQDFGRKELRHERRAKGSLDQRYEPDGDAGPYDAALAAYDADQRRQTRETLEAEASRQDAERLVAWGIAQIKNDDHREVLELTYIEKLSGAAIARRLGITNDNVYQRRRRGTLELERILREHPRP